GGDLRRPLGARPPHLVGWAQGGGEAGRPCSHHVREHEAVETPGYAAVRYAAIRHATIRPPGVGKVGVGPARIPDSPAVAGGLGLPARDTARERHERADPGSRQDAGPIHGKWMSNQRATSGPSALRAKIEEYGADSERRC